MELYKSGKVTAISKTVVNLLGFYKIKFTVSNVEDSTTVMKINFIKVTTNTRPEIYFKSK
jgi:PKD repeat protein